MNFYLRPTNTSARGLGRAAVVAVMAVAGFTACGPQDDLGGNGEPLSVPAQRAAPAPITAPPPTPAPTIPRPTATLPAYRPSPLPLPLPASTPLPVPRYQSSGDLDCPDFQQEVWVGSYDPYNLDADGDGWGCKLQGDIDDSRSEIDDLLSDLDYDSPYYDDAEDLNSRLDDVEDPSDLDDFYNDLDDLRSEVEEYED